MNEINNEIRKIMKNLKMIFINIIINKNYG